MRSAMYPAAVVNTYGTTEFDVRVVCGAASIAQKNGMYVTVTRTGVGTYTVKLDRPYAALTCFNPGVFSAAATVGSITITNLTNLPVDGSFTIVTRNAAGAVTDPANGDQFWLFIKTTSDAGGFR